MNRAFYFPLQLLVSLRLFIMTESTHSEKAVPETTAVIEIAPPLGEKSSVQENSDVIDDSETENDPPSPTVAPLKFKILSVLLVSAIGFGSAWSSGITGAMKTTLKKASVAMF